MKCFSDNLVMLILAFVMGLSSMQGAYASANKCTMMDQNMQGQMEMASVENNHINDVNSNNECCEKHECSTTHCANVVAISLNDFNNISYDLKIEHQITNRLLISLSSSSLYRPPKI